MVVELIYARRRARDRRLHGRGAAAPRQILTVKARTSRHGPAWLGRDRSSPSPSPSAWPCRSASTWRGSGKASAPGSTRCCKPGRGGALLDASASIRRRARTGSSYAISLLAFSAASFLVLYLILRFQDLLPFNPQGFAGMSPDLAFNTAISFVTNTNWQSYTPEQTPLGLLPDGGPDQRTTSSPPPPASPSPRPWRAPSPPTAARASATSGSI